MSKFFCPRRVWVGFGCSYYYPALTQNVFSPVCPYHNRTDTPGCSDTVLRITASYTKHRVSRVPSIRVPKSSRVAWCRKRYSVSNLWISFLLSSHNLLSDSGRCGIVWLSLCVYIFVTYIWLCVI